MNLALIDLFYKDEEWGKLRRPGAEQFARRRLDGLSRWLGDKPFLDGDRFTVGDLMMASVLRIVAGTNLVSADPRLGPYLERCTSRPAFRRAMDAHMSDFKPAT
jgi:glutathione S-transferase